MKWVAGLLLIANVVVYLWATSGESGAGPGASAKPDVNADAMRLLHEIHPSGAAAAAEGRDPADAAAAEIADVRDADIEPSGIDIHNTPPGARRSCHRIGPFKGGAGWSSATRWMRAQRFTYQAIRSERRETRVVRVYLGPFDSQAAATPALEKLKETNFDHFIEPDPADRKIYISLGYFTQEELAAKYVTHLLARDIKASSRDDYRDIGPHDWMEMSVNTTDRRDLLLSRNWAEQSAVVVEVDCRDLSLSGAAGS
ncbi:MAG: SPOR domain-containing protein [Gammaproteobacteria bacterium]|nr:SPOR domain-containing protein [Gammaproteobacteria bacterium]